MGNDVVGLLEIDRRRLDIFFCDEGSTAVGERDTWSRGR